MYDMMFVRREIIYWKQLTKKEPILFHRLNALEKVVAILQLDETVSKQNK